MNAKENSTGLAGEATVTCVVPAAPINTISNMMDIKGGVYAKAIAAKHLSELLTFRLEEKFGSGKGKPGEIAGSRIIILHEHQQEGIQWLAAEVWEVCADLATQVDLLIDLVGEIADPAYLATKAVAK